MRVVEGGFDGDGDGVEEVAAAFQDEDVHVERPAVAAFKHQELSEVENIPANELKNTISTVRLTEKTQGLQM